MKLLLGDCLEKMKDIENNSIDMVLCDLPFGVTQNNWDVPIPFSLLWIEYERIIKNNGVIALFAISPFDKILACSNLSLFKYEWIWEKNKSTGYLNCNKAPLRSHEKILIFYKNQPFYNPIMSKGKPYNNKHKPGDSGSNYGKVAFSQRKDIESRFPRDIIKFSVDMKAEYHPTQKPIKLLQYLIKTYTKEGDTVLDNTMGSGSTGVACIGINRNFIGIEKDKDFFNIAVKRIKESQITFEDQIF